MRGRKADLRSNNFDFLRFFLASAVIFSHSFSLLGHDANEPLRRVTDGMISIGTAAVYGFFVISGFLITQSWLSNPGLGTFLAKRISRIYPGYIVAMAISYFVVAAMGGVPLKWLLSFRDLAVAGYGCVIFEPMAHLAAFAKNPYPYFINGSIWTLRFELLCYMLLPVLSWTGLVKRKRIAPILLVFLIFLSVFMIAERVDCRLSGTTLEINSGFWLLLIQFGGYFVAGMVANLYRSRIGYCNVVAMLALVSLVAATFSPPILNVIGPVALAYLILWFAFNPRIRLGRFGRYGDFSYGIYIYAFPIQQLLVLWMGATIHPWLLFLVAWPISILAGALSWHLVEHPAMWVVKRFFGKPSTGRGVEPLAVAPIIG